MGKHRTSNEIIADILTVCPTHITKIMLKANVESEKIHLCMEKGLIKTSLECPKLHRMVRKKPVKIYRITPKGTEFLHRESNVKDG